MRCSLSWRRRSRSRRPRDNETRCPPRRALRSWSPSLINSLRLGCLLVGRRLRFAFFGYWNRDLRSAFFGPIQMEEVASGLIDALVGVSAEIVTLGLEEIGGKAC